MTIEAKGLFGATAVSLMSRRHAPRTGADDADPQWLHAAGALERDVEQFRSTKCNGVMCPPDVDPAMKAPTPSTGDKSVIPPPGTPGGDPTCSRNSA